MGCDVNSGRKCGECIYIKRTKMGQHECRRHGPWPMIVPRQRASIGLGGMEQKTDLVVQGFFPPVREDTDMCGEFEAANGAPAAETKQ